MFSRRHPFLYFFLSISAICGGTACVLAIVIAMGISSQQDADTLGGERVGIVEVEGTITDASRCLKELKEFRKDDGIKAVVLRIDSPGGGIGPSQEIYREVIKTKETKPVIASMGALAASGGYYIAAGATGIMANPGTITGSIGVIMAYTNIEQLLSKLGLSPVVIKSGKLKDAGSPLRPMSEEESVYLHDLASLLHRQFIGDVAKARGMEEGAVTAIADGRILSGATAHELGLVDRLGNMEDAIEWAGRQGGIKGEISIEHAHKRRIPLLDYVMEEAVRIVMDRIETHAVQMDYR